ncbi:MAG: ABC transporter permease [Terriglobia bacterium]
MATLLQDLKYGLRMLAKNPGFTAVAVLTLALGIGANTAIFSVAEAVLFPPFMGTQPSRLAAIYTSGPDHSGYASSSYPDYLYYREHSRTFSAMAAYVRVEVGWTHENRTDLPWAEVVSSNYFDVLGIMPFRGRFFLASESHAAGPKPIVIVAYRFWREHMASNPDFVGHALMLGGRLFTVIGVAPQGFEGVQLNWGQPPDFWFPMGTEQTFLGGTDLLDARQARWCLVVGRLHSGVTIAQGANELRVLAGQLERAHPDADKGRTGLVIPFAEGRIWPTWRQKIASMLWQLGFFAGLVLLVACADVANLLLARGTSRQREIGVRVALGASRARVMRQLLTESMLISLAGAGLGLVLAHWMAEWITTFRKLFTIQLALHPANLDARVLIFALALSLVTGIVFGLAPAFQVSRVDINVSLKQAGVQSSADSRHRWLRHSLVVAEISIAFIGIAGASMLLHTLRTLDSTNLGLDPHHVLSVNTEVYTRRYDSGQGVRFYSELLGRVRAFPSVQSAALAFDSPLTTMHFYKSVEKPGQALQNAEAWTTIEGNVISPDYFTTLRIPLLRGRDFRPQDNQQAPPAVIVNRTLAQMFWPHQNPIGKHLQIKGESAEAEVIGVAGDVKQHDLWQAPEPFLYQPFAQSFTPSYVLLIRTRDDAPTLLPMLKQQVAALDPQVPVYGAETLEQVAADSVAEPRMAASLVSSFGALILILAVAGIYSVTSYSVTQRLHEMGIRMALGAQKSDVLRLVVGQGMILASAGVGIGLAGALSLTRLLSNLLYGVKPANPLTFAGVSLLLISVAMLACYIPARRATRVDPMVALRYE